jgi:hypothetical protein
MKAGDFEKAGDNIEGIVGGLKGEAVDGLDENVEREGELEQDWR